MASSEAVEAIVSLSGDDVTADAVSTAPVVAVSGACAAEVSAAVVAVDGGRLGDATGISRASAAWVTAGRETAVDAGLVGAGSSAVACDGVEPAPVDGGAAIELAQPA